MIFASDLDRTLIYTEKFIPEDVKEYQVVDIYQGRNISHMTDKSLELLKSIKEDITFIPVTTSTEDEYKRVFGIYNLNPKYAVVANGGRILVNGVEDVEWKNHVSNTLSGMGTSVEDIHGVFFEHVSHDYFNREKLSDNLFWMLRLEHESTGDTIVEVVKPIIESHGYDITRTGRKICIVPKALTKWKALSYLINKLGAKKVIAAGDSMMDLEMVSNADIGITLLHGEIVGEGNVPSGVCVTKETGVLAGQEVLEIVSREIKKEA